MPYVSNMDDEQKQDPNAPQQGAVAPTGGGGGSVRLSPQSSVAPVGGGGTSSGTTNGAVPPPASAGGSFATLNKYIDANQGQAAPLAGQITSGIGQQYNNLDAQNNAAIASINNQVTNAPGYTASNPNTLSQEQTDPVSFSSDPNNVKQFQSLLNNTYSGPASAEGTTDYTNQQTSINNAIAAGQAATGTEAGRENLLVQNEAAPTTGVTALNSAILSQDPNALSSIQNAYNPFSNLLTNLNTGAQAADTTIGKEQQDATTSSAAANKQIADQIAALNSNVNNEYSGLQDKYNAANTAETALTSGLQNGKLPSGYGVDPGLQTFINSNINPWVAANAPGQSVSYNFANAIPQLATTAAPTVGQAATAQDYTQAQAFQNLLRGLNTQAPAMVINPSTANQAGTYAIPALPNVNNQALAGDIQAGFQSVPVNTAAGPYHQYLDLLAALNKYQGLPGGTGPGGVGYNGATDVYGNPIPTIA
jgi:hypothetical protein